MTSERSDPWWNMALDEGLLNCSIRFRSFPQVRLYSWDRPTLSIGAHVPVDPEIPIRCSELGIALLRRPTGGGAVLHSGDLTYSVVAPITGGILDCYAWVAEALMSGLRKLGVDAGLVNHGKRADALACFARPTGADLQVNGRKICGSAQLRRGGWFLQHGSIPLGDSRSITHSLLGTDPIQDRSTFLAEFRLFEWSEVAEGILRGFREVWGPPADLRPPTRAEEEEVSRLGEEKYSSLLNPIGLV